MVLTNAQVTAFFTFADGMGIPAATVAKLADEGISTPDDLWNFDEKTLDKVAESLRRPHDRIPNPDPGAPPGATIPRPPYEISAQSLKRLLDASNLVRYFRTTGRELTPPTLRYDPVIQDFATQWKALKDRKDDKNEIPKISKNLQILKWFEAFDDFLSLQVGTRNIPLAYLTREIVDPPNPPALLNNRAYSVEHGSVEGELVARASHTHASYREDNLKLYHYLGEATRSTSYASSLKPYQRAKDGRSAYLSMRHQYAGRDKYEAEIKHQDDLVHTRVWKGQSNFSLEKFIAQHRNAYVSMRECAQHIDFQLPNEHTRVGYLLTAIQCSDPTMQAALANVTGDDGPTGKRNNFERAASYLLPSCPVAKKRVQNNSKRSQNEISSTAADVSAVAGFGSKPGIGKSGVHFRYHNKDEYKTLTKDQKLELKEWREKNGGKKKGGGNSALSKKQVAAMIAASKKQADTADDGDDIDALIMSLQSATDPDSPPTPPPPTKKVKIAATTSVNTSALKSILRRVKNTN